MAPRVTIAELPEQTTTTASDLLVLQDGPTTKKILLTNVAKASAVSAVANPAPMTGTTVQAQLNQAATAILAIGPGGGGTGGITADDAVDVVASQISVSGGLTKSYSDPGNQLALGLSTFTPSSNGGVPASASADTTKYLNAAGSWTVPAGSGGGGGTGGRLSFTFNSTTTVPPLNGQLRLNSASQTAATHLYVSRTDPSGADVAVSLGKILAGYQIYFQDYINAANWVKYSVTSTVAFGTYIDYTVTYHSGPATVPFQTVEFEGVAPGALGVPPGGTVGQVLGKTGSADYAVGWVADVTGGGGGGGITTDDAINAVQAAMTGQAPIIVTHDVPSQTIRVSAPDVALVTTSISAGTGLTGGGTLTSSRTIGMANMAALTLKGNNTGAVAAPVDLTVAQTKTLLGYTAGDISGLNAGAISNTPAGTVAATTVQLAINELDTEKATTASVTALSTSKVTNGGGAATIVALSQTAYDALSPKDSATLYVII